MSINKRVLCISGFQQGLYRPTGLERLWLKLRSLYSSPSTAVCLYPWNFEWEGLANHFLRTVDDPKNLDIRVAAYSWGCGYGLLRLAKALRYRGLSIQVAVLSDPVYHSWWALWRSLWSPLIGEPVITIPANITQCWYFRQRTTIPYGTRCKAEDPIKTQVLDYGILNRSHAWMDDATEFHDLMMKAMLLPGVNDGQSDQRRREHEERDRS